MAAPRRPALTASVTRGLDKLLPTIPHQIDPDCANALKYMHAALAYGQSAEYAAKRAEASERIQEAKRKRKARGQMNILTPADDHVPAEATA